MKKLLIFLSCVGTVCAQIVDTGPRPIVNAKFEGAATFVVGASIDFKNATIYNLPGGGGGGGTWGSIIGTLSNQTDLQNALNAKQTLTGTLALGSFGAITGTLPWANVALPSESAYTLFGNFTGGSTTPTFSATPTILTLTLGVTGTPGSLNLVNNAGSITSVIPNVLGTNPQFILPIASDTLVGRISTDAFQNKSIDFSLNTGTNYPAANLANLPLAINLGGTNATAALPAIQNLAANGADIASASTVDLNTATGLKLNITGNNPISSFGTVTAGGKFRLHFTGTLTITYNAVSMILPSAINLPINPGDEISVESLGSGNWRCTAYFPINGFTEPYLSLSNVTTNNASTGKHGLMPILDNNVNHFFNGQGNQVVPISAFTTTGTSGAATYNTTTGALNIPNYAPAGVPVYPAATPPSSDVGMFIVATNSFAYTDLTSDATTNTKVTSVTRPFVASDVGLWLNVTSGSSWSVQSVKINSVLAGVATLASSSGGTSLSGGHAQLGVDLKTAGSTAIFVVPTSRTYICTSAQAIVNSVTGGAGGTETFKITESGTSGNMTAAGVSGSSTPAAGTWYGVNSSATGGPFTACTATNAVQFTASTSQAGSTAVNGQVFVVGYYSQ